MPGSYTTGQTSILAGIQLVGLRLKVATLSLARRAVEPGHLRLSALTCPSSADARRLKSWHPFVPASQRLISSCDNNNIRVVQWADHRWKAEWLDKNPRLRTFISVIVTHPPEMARTAWVRFSASAPVSDVSAPYTNGVWPLLLPVSMFLQKKRRPCCTPMSTPSTSPWTAQPDGSGWWDNRLTDFSTHALISSAAKQ